MVTTAVSHQFSTRLHALVFQVVWVIFDMANSSAAVATWSLIFAQFRTRVAAASHYCFVLAFSKSFLNLHGTIHLGRICATFDLLGQMSTVELFFYNLWTNIATLDKALLLAQMQSGNAKSLTRLLALDFGMILQHEVTNLDASVATIECIVTHQSASPSWRMLQRISGVLKVKSLGWMNFTSGKNKKSVTYIYII